MLNTCNSEDTPNENEKSPQNLKLDEFPQKWQLFQMTGQMSDEPPSKGEDMSWQEFYVLNADKTFTKQREHNGEVTESKGTYTFSNSEDENLLILKHNLPSQIIGNCTGDNTETLSFDKKKSNFIGTWWACDGPGLFYKRIE